MLFTHLCVRQQGIEKKDHDNRQAKQGDISHFLWETYGMIRHTQNLSHLVQFLLNMPFQSVIILVKALSCFRKKK